MPSLNDIRAALPQLTAGPPIVAVLTGGTTAIDAYTAQALAGTFANHGQRLRVYIVVRNAARGEQVVADGRRISPGSEWIFIRVTDLALISEVDRACDDIVRREKKMPFFGGPPRVDLLI